MEEKLHPLEMARRARGWKRWELAREIRALGAAQNRPIGTSRDAVCRWENGDRNPDRRGQELLADLFGVPLDTVRATPWPDWLHADPARQPPQYPWLPAGAARALIDLSGGDMIKRRDFITITGTTLTASLWAWLTAEPAAAGQITHGRRIGEEAVAHIERRAAELRHADDVDGGGSVITETAATLTLVASLLRDRTYTDTHGARLYAAAADIARQHAWARFDVHGECADRVFATALRAAHAAGDTELGGNVLAFWAVTAYNTGRKTDAEAMASTAVSAVQGRSTPRVEAMLTARRGRARAQLGDPGCWADYDRAETLLARADQHQDQDPAWAYWFDRTEILGARASTHLDNDRPGAAEAEFAELARDFSPDRIRTHTLWVTRQADAQLRQGQVEHAAATAHRALDLYAATSSHRSSSPLRDLAGMFAAHDTTDAQDFVERARVLLTA
ncbi:transcriptional regulator [Yinghuangia aomiensis]